MGVFGALFGVFSKDLGIDLGTANTLVHVQGKGVVLSEPSVVAIDKKTKQVLAVGAEAKRMVGRTPANIVAVRPLKDGVIADFEIVEQMLRYFIGKVHTGFLMPRPRVVVGIPSGVTEVEKRAVHDAAIRAGAREAFLIEEPMAAAIGAGLPVHEPTGNMVVDIGGGTTEVAVISLEGIVVSRSLRVAGDEIDEAILQYARREHSLAVGERTAEETKIKIGSAYNTGSERMVELRGRDLITGLPKVVEVTSSDIREAIANPVNQIVEEVKVCVEETPPELVADIMESGITLAGGGALLAGMSITLLVLDQTHQLQPAEEAAAQLLTPAQTALTSKTDPFFEFWSTVSQISQLRQENESLRQRVAQLEAQSTDLARIETENETMRAQLKYAQASPRFQLLPATVVGKDLHGLNDFIEVDRGAADGLKPRMTVVSPEGYLVGRILTVTEHRARVLIITNPSSSVAAVISKDAKAEDVVDGKVHGRLAMSSIPQTAKLNVGEDVFTSGLGGNFPKGLKIGQIATLNNSDVQLFQQAEIAPYCDFARLAAIEVITNNLPLS